jgi:hypothetical protein
MVVHIWEAEIGRIAIEVSLGKKLVGSPSQQIIWGL